MKSITKNVLGEWADRIASAVEDVSPKRSTITALSRQEAASRAAIKVFARKEAAAARLSAYLDSADRILAEEERRLNGS